MKNTKPHVLLIEDDNALCQTLGKQLSNEYDIDRVVEINTAKTIIEKTTFDLFIVDLIFPGQSTTVGIELCHQIRMRDKSAPIIVITGKSAINYKMSAFKAGINDYVCKPFNTLELGARMKVWLNMNGNMEKVLTHRDIRIDLAMHTVTRAHKPIDLRKKEFELLKILVLNKQALLTRDTIMRKLALSEDIFSNVVDVHIRNLRKKIDVPFKYKVIKTVHGVGYGIQ